MMASNNYMKPSERSQPKRGLMEVDTMNSLLAQVKALSMQNATIQRCLGMNAAQQTAQVLACDFCGGNQTNGDCNPEFQPSSREEQINYMVNALRNNPYSNTYN